jgi:hypothetical protein
MPHSTVETNLTDSPWHSSCVWNGISFQDGVEVCANGTTYVCTNGVWKCENKRC